MNWIALAAVMLLGFIRERQLRRRICRLEAAVAAQEECENRLVRANLTAWERIIGPKAFDTASRIFLEELK